MILFNPWNKKCKKNPSKVERSKMVPGTRRVCFSEKCNLYIYTVINKSPCDHTNVKKEKGGKQWGKLYRTGGDHMTLLAIS